LRTPTSSSGLATLPLTWASRLPSRMTRDAGFSRIEPTAWLSLRHGVLGAVGKSSLGATFHRQSSTVMNRSIKFPPNVSPQYACLEARLSDQGVGTRSTHRPSYLRRSVEAANGALRIALEQYEQGATSFTSVLTAEQNLFQAQNSLAGASANVPLGLTAVFRALGGGWQIREGGNFVSPATVDQMRARTDWGNLLPPPSEPQPPAPGLPGPEDIGPTIRPPEW
jgi:hypothetical protein